ncbi:hypothetical protein [Myxococcus faecalis]|uniref:PIN-like domain-containing protein n=1 Tax=Myxococcus faecalis TaxID=3115646 RepID=UPI003CF72465
MEILRVLKEDVRALKEEFPVETPDQTWIPTVGKQGWILVTADRNIKSKPHERLALQQSKLTAFFLVKGFGDQKLWDYAIALLKVWPQIKKVAETAQPGDSYRVTLTGNVEPFL